MDPITARLCLLAIAASLPASCWAQSIDIRDARATLGQPFELSLRVKGSETGTALLAPHCVEAALDGEALRWQAAQALGDGAVRVRFAATPAIEQPWLHITAALRCGATYVREFTVLAEAPPDAPPDAPSTNRAEARPAPTHPLPPRPTATTSVRPALPSGEATRRAPESAAVPASPKPGALALIEAPAPSAPAPARHGPAAAPAAEAAPAHPMSQALLALWQQDLGELKREQHQARAQLAGLHNRLERQEQVLWSAALAGLAAGVGVALAQALLRRLTEARLRRFSAPATAATPAGAAAPPASTDDTYTGPVATGSGQPAPITAAEPAAREQPEPVEAAPPRAARQHEAGSRWQGRDFGHADIDERRHARLFATADAMNATGYPGASLALLETAAHGGGGKGPGLLLRLLDLYRQLGQPANEERVGAELAGLYPVRPATLVQADEGRPLEAHASCWARIVASWSQAEASDVLAGLLTEPGAGAALDLAAFRELVFLHELSLARESAPHITARPAAAPPAEDELGQWTLQALPG